MGLSLYDRSVPVFIRGIRILRSLLDKGEAHAIERAVVADYYVQAQLAPDMAPLARQVQFATDSAKFGSARLSQAKPPSFPDTELTFEELRRRCDATLRFLESLNAHAFQDAEEREIKFPWDGRVLSLPADVYLLQYGYPNFFFHITTAYDILRHIGVPLGKRDYLGLYDGVFQ